MYKRMKNSMLAILISGMAVMSLTSCGEPKDYKMKDFRSDEQKEQDTKREEEGRMAQEERSNAAIKIATMIMADDWDGVLAASYKSQYLSPELLRYLAQEGQISLADAEGEIKVIDPGPASKGTGTVKLGIGSSEYSIRFNENNQADISSYVKGIVSEIGVAVPKGTTCLINEHKLEADKMAPGVGYDNMDSATWEMFAHIFGGLTGMDEMKGVGMSGYGLSKLGLPAESFDLYIVPNVPKGLGKVQAALPDGRSVSFDLTAEGAEENIPAGISYNDYSFIVNYPD